MRRAIAVLLGSALVGAAGHAREWTVGPGGDALTMGAALKLARDGDSLLLLPGEHQGLTATIRHQALWIRGAGPGRPVIRADGKSAQGKATWVVNGGLIRIENVEFRDARAGDMNGAGIRLEGGQLQVVRCAFIDNETGVMAANKPSIKLSIEDSHFENAVRTGQRLSHLLYVGQIGELRVRGSRFHHVEAGHLIKSRAQRSWLAYNLVADGPKGSASYEVEFPNGGDVTLVGNVVVQGRRTENNVVIGYGAEGNRWPLNRLRLAHNTLVNERLAPAQFLRVWADRVSTPEVLAINNLTVGTGSLGFGVAGTFAGNVNRWGAVLTAPEFHDYSLRSRTWALSEAVATAPFGDNLLPEAEFKLPVGTHALPPSTTWVPGAIQR